MSNSSIEGRLKGLQERIEHDIRNLNPRDGGFQTPGGLGSSRPGSGRRPRPPLFSNREIPVFPPRSPHATETENRMREVYKVSGKLNVDGVEYRSHIGDLLHQGELGSGTCGHVVKMKHKPSGAVIAVKQMRRSGNSEETKRILMDLDVVVRSHDCPYIVRCLGCFVTDADVWICMELMASCFDKLLKRVGAPIPEAILGKVTVATVNALSYLKDSHGVIHRDVKPSNILLDERGNVKLCDFGISGRLVDSKAKTRSAGCAAYMAPERIDPPDPTRPDYDIRADVWSLGISLVELATGVFPYRDCQNDFEVLTRVIEEEPPRLPADCDFSPEFKSFVSQCLQKNYRQRPKYAKLLEHAFVVKSARSSVSVGDWYASLPGANAANATGQTMGVGLSATGQPMGIGLSATGQPMGIGLSATGQPMGIGLSATGQPISVMLSPTGQPISAALSTAHSMPPPIPLRSYESTAPSNPISVTTVATHTIPAASNGLETTPVNSYVTSAHFWTPEQITPTPQRARWATPSIFSHGGSTSQPTSLESDYSISPFPRRRTIDACASPPPPPVRRVSAENRWRASPASSGNTSPIVLQRFYHQTQQRRSRVDLHSTPRHRSLSREHSTGRSPEPPPRTSRQHHMLGHEANGSIELEPPPLHERLHPPSPLLLNNRLSEGRSQSLTRAELRNGYRSELAAAAAAAAAAAPQSKHNHDDQSWLHSLAGLVKRRLSQVKWHHVVGLHNNHPSQPHAHRHHVQSRWNSSESWSVPVSPLPPRAPPPRPAD